MNVAMGKLMPDQTAHSHLSDKNVDRRRATRMNCPVCGSRATVRSSGEVTPEYRRLYYGCENVECGMTWAASLCFDHVMSPSGLGTEFREATSRDDKPPGHDFGQMTIFEVLSPPPPD